MFLFSLLVTLYALGKQNAQLVFEHSVLNTHLVSIRIVTVFILKCNNWPYKHLRLTCSKTPSFSYTKSIIC